MWFKRSVGPESQLAIKTQYAWKHLRTPNGFATGDLTVEASNPEWRTQHLRLQGTIRPKTAFPQQIPNTQTVLN